VLVVASAILQPIALDVLAVPIALSSLAALVPVRLRYRRKIIRDVLAFYLTPRRMDVSKRRS
jgi:heme exporter protein D